MISSVVLWRNFVQSVFAFSFKICSSKFSTTEHKSEQLGPVCTAMFCTKCTTREFKHVLLAKPEERPHLRVGHFLGVVSG